MASNLVSRLRLRSFKVQAAVFAVISVSLFGAITLGGLNLLNHLRAQDEVLMDGLSRSERGFSQLDREVLRLAILVEASHDGFDSDAVQQQIDILKSRLEVIRKHHINDELPPELAGELVQFDQAWNGMQGDLNRWLADPSSEALRTELATELESFEQIINNLANQDITQRRVHYGELVGLRSGTIWLILIIFTLFLTFIVFAGVCTARFIKERQRMLVTIREKEQQYRRIIETAEEGIWLLDPQGKTLFANHKLATILGLNEADLGNVSLWEFLPPDTKDTDEINHYFAKLRQGERSPQDLKLVRRDGKTLWVLNNGTPIFDEMGRHTGTLCMLTDVTARRQSEEALKLAKQKAEVANQAKSEFLASMSHELRTPLNGILGFAQILSCSTSWGDKEKRGVDIIYQCGVHLLTLIDDVLDLAKIEARKLVLDPKSFHLQSCLQGIVEICRLRAERKKLKFVYQPAENLPEAIVADEKRLRQVLINLLGNAVKFTDCGSVSLTVDVLPPTAGFPSHETTRLRFSVTDTGVGIKAEQLESVFQPFEQVGNQRKHEEGTGLGLAISQKIVTLMGSQLHVQSEVGQGSNFWFDVEVPIVSGWVAVSNPFNQKTIQGYRGERRHVLVVDDRWENRSVIIGMLEPLGFEVTEAQNGRAAFEKMLESPPDVVITDLMVPVMGGCELLMRIRASEKMKHVIAIASSASVFESNQQEAIAAGANVFLPKPLRASLLLQTLQQYLNLEWIYEASAKGSPIVQGLGSIRQERILPPTREVLQQLRVLVENGDVQSIAEMAEQLQASDTALSPFAHNILQLVNSFQLKRLQTFIEDSLDSQSQQSSPVVSTSSSP